MILRESPDYALIFHGQLNRSTMLRLSLKERWREWLLRGRRLPVQAAKSRSKRGDSG